MKFRPLANLELKFCWKLLHKNEKKYFPELYNVHGCFMLKIGNFGSGA